MSDALEPAKSVLFFDVRHIRCGDLQWRSPDGQSLPVAGPPEPQVEATASLGYVPRGIRLEAQKAQVRPIPKEGAFGRVIHKDGLYRSWVLTSEHQPDKDLGAYSTAAPVSVAVVATESKDGFQWVERSRCAFDAPGQTGHDGFTFFLDPAGDPNERFKAVYTARAPSSELPAFFAAYQQVHPRYRDTRMTEQRLYCMYGLVSPDGMHWERIREPLMVHMSDTDTTVYYDSWLRRYVMYTRLYWQERRWVGRAEAEDFRRWGPVQPLLWPPLDGPLSDDIYTNGRTTFPGLPDYHLMFPMVYHRYTQTSDVHLYASADGICWNRVPGGPVITRNALGEDIEFIGGGKDLVPLAGDSLAIPFGGTPFPHKYPRWQSVLDAYRRGWACWPNGRLCAVVADQEGEFHTFALPPAGRKLKLNVRTRRSGYVRVGLAGVPGRSADDCDPVFGDKPAQVVGWKGVTDIGAPEGAQVTLHFKLRSAELFGLEWE